MKRQFTQLEMIKYLNDKTEKVNYDITATIKVKTPRSKEQNERISEYLYGEQGLATQYNITNTAWEIDINNKFDLEVPHPYPVGLPIITDQIIWYYKHDWKEPVPEEMFDFVVPEGTYADLWKVIDSYVGFLNDVAVLLDDKFPELPNSYNQFGFHLDHRWIEGISVNKKDLDRKVLKIHFGS